MSDNDSNLSIAQQVSRKSGDEKFMENGTALDFSLLEFWQWSGSDLANNALRGKLAEFIVAQALGKADGVRIEWDAYDLLYKGRSIEVKSAAYVQSWAKKKHSSISFSIRPTREWIDNATLADEASRQSDVYVFCLLKNKDRKTLDPLCLDQWEFYVLRTADLDRELGEQKTLSLNRLQELQPVSRSFIQLKEAIECVVGGS